MTPCRAEAATVAGEARNILPLLCPILPGKLRLDEVIHVSDAAINPHEYLNRRHILE